MARLGTARLGEAGHGMGLYSHLMESVMAKEMKTAFGGKPTRPVVDELMRSINAGPGMSASYESIGGIIGAEPGTSRFRTVTTAWRRRLFSERGIATIAEDRTIKFLTADEHQNAASGGFVRLERASHRHMKFVRAVRHDDLSSEERRTLHRLQMREAAAVAEATRMAAQRQAEPKPVTQSNVRLAE